MHVIRGPQSQSVSEIQHRRQGGECLGPYLLPAALCVCERARERFVWGVASPPLKILTVTLSPITEPR